MTPCCSKRALEAAQCTTGIQKFEDEAGTMGMHKSRVKKKIQKVGSGSTPAPIPIAGQTVDLTDKFMYLGSDIDSSGYCSPDIRRRLGLASSTLGQLYWVWRNKRLSTPTNLRIYSKCVLPVLLYGSETWTLLAEDMRRVQAFHVTCQRHILGIQWWWWWIG